MDSQADTRPQSAEPNRDVSGSARPQTPCHTEFMSAKNRQNLSTRPKTKPEPVMEIHEYENAYYQVQDEVIESLPLEKDEEAFLD